MKSINYNRAATEVISAIENSGRSQNAIGEYRIDVILGRCYETVPGGGLVATANSDEFWGCVEDSRRSVFGNA